jgi:hypothetical protein
MGDAARLERLRQWRNEADYDDVLKWHDVESVVVEAIKEAEKVFKSLSPPAAGSAPSSGS